ncbi:Gametolysin peptidase M11-domain-containing protein [Haematococcus lacustris]
MLRTLFSQPLRRVQQPRVLFLIVAICDQPAAIGAEELRSVLFRGPDSGWEEPTLEAYYTACSLGQAAFNAETSLVVDGLQLGCEGESEAYGPWSADNCGYSSYMGWAEEASRAAEEQGVDLSAFSHRLLVLPSQLYDWAGPACTWSFSYDQPGAFAYAWVVGDMVTYIQAFFHELGHNMGLGHAGRFWNSLCSTCDWSSAMGACCRTRCFNAPHAWQVGWLRAAPSAVFSSANLLPGHTVTLSLPATINDPDSLAVVYPDWVLPRTGALPYDVIFISYRALDGGEYDSAIPFFYTGGLLIHTWNGAGQLDGSLDSQIQARLFPGQTWSDGGALNAWLTVHLVNTSASLPGGPIDTAAFTICRPTVPGVWCEVTCYDGLDNDCDGLFDQDDPDSPDELSGGEASPADPDPPPPYTTPAVPSTLYPSPQPQPTLPQPPPGPQPGANPDPACHALESCANYPTLNPTDPTLAPTDHPHPVALAHLSCCWQPGCNPVAGQVEYLVALLCLIIELPQPPQDCQEQDHVVPGLSHHSHQDCDA